MARNVFAPGLVITVALVATLSGCGGEDGPQAQAAPPTPAFVQGTTAPRAQPLVTPKPQSTSARPARTPVPRATPADTVRITIQNFKFSPPTLTVKLGQTIEVVNLDSADHTLTADDGSFDSGTLKKGQRYTFTPKEAGTYTYVCDIHQYMTGTITVT